MEGAGRLQVDVLGPLRARDAAGRDATPDGDLQRRLLALLVLRRGDDVSAEAAVEALWPRRRPRDPLAALQTHVFRLRRSLPSGALRSNEHGYRLDPAAVQVDADALTAAVNDADATTDPATTARTLADALAAWRGGAYPELADVDDGRIESARLDELRVRAMEGRAEALLMLGQPSEVTSELTALAAAHPLRERPHELLMTGLAAAGRTVEALRVYDDFRRRLGDELGIEPSPLLTARHASLLGGSGGGPALTHRLPEPLTSMLGRDELLADTVSALDAHRLVTLLGPGGVGKTRLLVEVGHTLRQQRPARPVVLSELATATADSAVDAVALTLGVDHRPGHATEDRLAALIADDDVVLLIDNCEHVLEPIAALVELLLSRCPRLAVACTSRERLRVPGEHLRPVAPLPLLEGGGPADDLFVERARAVRPEFTPDAADRAGIREIVRRLDGLPLAIELAAARLHTLDLDEIMIGLDRRFRLLAFGPRTASRHRSLSAAIEWSFDLMPRQLRKIFADLSTFVGSFDVEGVAAVSAIDEAAAADALDALTERSLVVRGSSGRYSLLETLRAFGTEQLVADGRDVEVRARHARHFTDWLRSADIGLMSSESTGLIEIDAALPDLATAFGWLLDHGDLATAAEMVVALENFGYLRLRPDVLAWSDRVLATAEVELPEASRLWAMSALGAWLHGDVAGMTERLSRARRARTGPAGEPPSATVQGIGNQALFEGRLDEAIVLFERARELAAGTASGWVPAAGTAVLARTYGGDPTAVEAAAQLLADIGDDVTPYTAFAWYCAGEAMLSVDPPLARHRLRRAMAIADSTGCSFVTGIAGTSLASIEARSGDPAAAAEQYGVLLDHWRRAGVWSTQWTTLRAIAGLLFRLGRFRDAAVLTAAVTFTTEGHRVFGEDAVALEALARQLRDELGDREFESAAALGCVLDGDAAVEHARRSLRS